MTSLRVLHRWLGLLLAAIVVAVAVSGGVLLLREPYYRVAYPALNAPATAAQMDARGDVLTTIESRWRGERVRLVRFPRSGMNAFHVWLGDGTEALVNPEDGAVIDRWKWYTRVPAFLFELHAHLVSAPGGTIVNGVAALCVVFMALTGVVFWWPARRGAFRLRGALPRRITPAQLLRSHAAVGAIAMFPIVLFAGTGAAIVFYDQATHVMSRLLDARSPEQPDARVTPGEGPMQPWTTVLTALDATFPEGETVFYSPGAPSNARLMFRKRLPGEWHPNGRSYVIINPYTADVVQAIDARAQGAGTRMAHAIYPIHAAKAGGITMVVLGACAAVALTWLALGGVWSYVSRRSTVTTSQPASIRKFPLLQAPGLSRGARRLADLPVGFTARVHDAQVDPESRSQLRALGLTDASLLRVCKQGEPCVVQVRATRIGISSRIAQQVFVIPSEGDDSGEMPCR